MTEKMRISFVQPPLSLKERYGTFGQLGYIEPPTGLCYLASVAREKNFEVQIVDAQALNLDIARTRDMISSFRPSIVGITAVTQLIVNAGVLAQEIKKINQQTAIIIGGCHVTSLPKETMRDFPYFDIGVLGEGEDTLSELLDALTSEKNINSVEGIIFRKTENLIQTKSRPRITNIDKLPFPAFDLLPRLEKYYHVSVQSINKGPTISLITSRGCNFQCTYCDASVHGRQLRYPSAEYTFKLLQHCIQKYKVKNFFFNDSNFFLPFSRFIKLADLIEKNGLNIKWSCMTRVDMMNEGILNLAKRAGCWQILYGIESGSQNVLDFYKRKMTLEQIRKNIALTKKTGIMVKGFFMFGNPLETEKTIKASIDFMREIDLDDVGIAFFVPFPGTIHYKNLSNYGDFKRRWEMMSGYIPVFIPNGFSEKKLLTFTKIAYCKFYFRWSIIFSYLKRCKSARQFKIFFLAGLIFVYYFFRKK